MGLALAGCGPMTANAGRRASVLFVPVGTRGPSSETERTLRRRLTERTDLEIVGLSRLAALAADVRGSRSSEHGEAEAQSRLEQADEAFSRFDYPGATAEIGEALALLQSSATTPSGRRRLASVHLQLAMVLLVHGERDAALEEVRTCLHLDPRCAPDPARHPPELVALREELRGASQEASVELRVTTDPPGARAALDGERAESTPAVWTGVIPGRHYLTLERDGFVTEVHVVSVPAGRPTERGFALTLASPEDRASAAVRELERRGVSAEPRWRAQATSLAAADLLLVLSIGEPGLALAAFDARGTALAAPLERETDDPSAALAWFEAAVPPPSVPFYGEWWFWTPLALALAVGFGALVFFLVRTPPVRLVGGEVFRE